MKDELSEVKQPTSLENSFELLNDILVDKEIFRATLENNAITMSHFSLGRWVRNNWHLWWSEKLASEYKDNNYPQERPEIVKYFNSVGIIHADDMSGIILTSYHRHLNQKPLDVEAQIKKYKQYWAVNANQDGEE